MPLRHDLGDFFFQEIIRRETLDAINDNGITIGMRTVLRRAVQLPMPIK
jgi:hypothetical protein